MIQFIKADGFRSLSKQIIKIEPGLNVLAGPNGAGKTNILTALDFIGHILEYGLVEAINKSGGVGGVFQRKADPEGDGHGINKSINFAIGGLFTVGKDGNTILLEDNADYIFVYEFRLSLDKYNNPKLSKQKFQLITIAINDSTLDAPIVALDIQEERQGKYTVKEASKDYLLDTSLANIENDSDLKAGIDRQLSRKNWPDKCLLERLSAISYLAWIASNGIQHSERLTINPDKLRYGDDFTASPEVFHDGSGTIRALHALKTNTLNGRTKKQCQEIYQEILNELRLAVEGINDLYIYEDTATTKYMLSLEIKDKKGKPIKVPAKFASEGTLKWLVLVTFIKTGSVFSLEEPENFLHPWMQIELIRLLRDYGETHPGRPVLLTTHSETLLNELNPEEIIITRMKDGLTKVSRPKNADSLNDEIRETGFKLGYYYVAGALDHG